MAERETNDDIRRDLESLVIDDEAFRTIETKLSGYCPFEALGMVNAEIRHSNFLAYMLDPFQSHGLGSQLLRGVLDGILASVETTNGVSRLGLHLVDVDDADIRREWKHIDLLLAFPDLRLVVAFELKIGAGEGSGQLKRYREQIEQKWPSSGTAPWRHLLLFLTRNGQDPSDPIWEPATYDVIIDAIERTLKKTSAGDPMARQMLGAYAAMLRRHHMKDQELAELAKQLWRQHGPALNYLMQYSPTGVVGLGPVVLKHIDKIAAEISSDHLHLGPEDSTVSYARFFVKEWDAIPGINDGFGWVSSGRLLVIEVQFWTEMAKACLLLGPAIEPKGNPDTRRKLFELARPKIMRGANTLPEKWKTLVSSTLITSADMELGEEEAMQKLKSKLKQFVSVRLTEFDALFRSGPPVETHVVSC